MRKLILFLLLTCSAFSEKYTISVASIFQNEARFLKEWIDYNIIIGVEHFWLYNNQSTDDYMNVLQPYIDSGVVELEEWPNLWPEIPFAWGCQAYAYQDALNKCRRKTKWLAIIDVDEFIVPLDCYSLKETLKKHYNRYSGVCIHWQCFGTSNVDYVHPEELMIERLTMKAITSSPHNGWYKSIFKVDHVETILNPHFPQYKPGKYPVNTNKEKNFLEANVMIKHLQINHYWTRDQYHLQTVKLPRYINWKASEESILKKASDLNEVQDVSILKFIPLMR